MKKICSWGRLTTDLHDVILLNHDEKKFKEAITQDCLGLAYGMGRSYGDVCLNPDGLLWLTTGLNRFIAFDETTGRLVCESGVLLRDIQQLTIPRGWALAVTPGTQMVTVGGAIANDVHGKNHHMYGSFGNHIKQLSLARTDGQRIDCNALEHRDWFEATIGGMGLTGIITQAEIQLRRVTGAWIDSETIAYNNLDDFFQLADDSEADWEHTVSWIDCSSHNERGLFMRGNFTAADDLVPPKKRALAMPFTPPISLVNKLTLKIFNQFYYHVKKRQAGKAVVYYEPFFYPLDSIIGWNKMYGLKGFFQYQSVVPRSDGKEVVRMMLKEIKRSESGSFLAVLKTFGSQQSMGMLSFPQPGVTLALDFPNKGMQTQKLFERLDSIVQEAGGRIYAAKDARMPVNLFEAGYPRLSEFLQYRDSGISSGLSRRLMGW